MTDHRPSLVLATLTLLLLLLLLSFVQAQSSDDCFSPWFERVTRTLAEQPHWITTMFTTTPRLEEEFRCDIASASPSPLASSPTTTASAKASN